MGVENTALPVQSDRFERILLTAQELEGHDPLGNLYDLAWNAFSDFESGKTPRASSKLVDLSRYPSVTTPQFLFDYRNAVGALITLYVAKRTEAPSFDPGMAEQLLAEVRKLRWHDFTGEVIFAYSILQKEMQGREDREAEVERICTDKVSQALPNLEQLAREARDVAYCVLTASYLVDRKQVLGWLTGSRAAVDKIVEIGQIETLAVVLWALCNIDPKADFVQVKELRNRLLQRLEDEVVGMGELSIDPGAFENVVNAIQLAKEGLLSQARARFDGIEDYADGKITINLNSLSVGMPRISLLAKSRIAMFKAGYLKPYSLSSKQSDLYQKILTANEKNFRFVRNFELGLGLLIGGVVVAVADLELLIALGPLFPVDYGLAIMAGTLGVYSDIAWGIWTEGAVTGHSMKRALRRLQESL